MYLVAGRIAVASIASTTLCINSEAPNSPDLNPMDYSIWDALQQLVCHQKFKKIDRLKQVLNSCWDMI